jgi:sirohydrochlorin cobaltochelatase
VKRGLLLFAHGARDPRWAVPFHAVADRIRTAAPALPVELAFLELMKPTLAEAAERLIDEGCSNIHVVPLFLGTGGHVRHDLPALMAEVEGRHPEVRIQLHPVVGEAEAVLDAMAQVALHLSEAAPAGTR